MSIQHDSHQSLFFSRFGLWRFVRMGAKEIKDTRKDLKLTMVRYGPLLQAAGVMDLVYMCMFLPLGLPGLAQNGFHV